jgi:NAD(P)H-quinone oxidoreductase subunit 5
MQSLVPWLLLASPAFPMLAGLAIRGRSATTAARFAIAAAAVSVLLAMTAVVALYSDGNYFLRLAPLGENSPIALTLKMDVVSATMGLLVSFLGFIVIRFSKNYLAGDARLSEFFSWMSLTLAAVLLLVLSGNLLVLLGAWVATSLCLHRLLLHYPRRDGAVFAARKKFVISRLGDLCLSIAILLIYHHFGTLEFDALFAAAAAGKSTGLPLICVFLAACAALKSAQFPFHGWLPDTMETPTPVSAFMHAGIINAGGFLVIRLSPLFVHAPLALYALAVLGAITAAFGAIVMLTQPSVKRSLAYSTIAQMGFMLLQCGLGAFGLALLHIVAHSLYKAHAFLHAGSTIGSVPRAAIKLPIPTLGIGLLASGLLVAGATTAWSIFLPSSPHETGIFTVVLALAIAYGLARAWTVGGGLRTAMISTLAAAGIATVSLALHFAAAGLFRSLPSFSAPAALVVIVTAVFVLLFIFQSFLWRAGKYRYGRSLYVHALNGFYIGTLGNRLLGKLWPSHPIQQISATTKTIRTHP